MENEKGNIEKLRDELDRLSSELREGETPPIPKRSPLSQLDSIRSKMKDSYEFLRKPTGELVEHLKTVYDKLYNTPIG